SATLQLARRMELTTGCHVLDIGSGLGGPARTLAEAHGCRVTGLDLSPDFCETARQLSRWVGLNDRCDFVEGDATALPFDAGTFDAAMTIHVGMNIEAKSANYSNAHRTMKPSRIF